MGRKTVGSLHQRGKRKTYYVRYMVEGAARMVRLLTPDGKPIYGANPDGKPLSRTQATAARKAAEEAADVHLSIFRISDKAEQLRQVKNDLRDAEGAAAEAEADILNARATIADGWELFMGCPKRPASCRRYKAGDDIPPHTCASNYRGYYRRFAAWLGDRHPDARLLSEVTPDMAAEFMEAISSRGAAGTVNKYLQFFKCFYITLADAGKITAQNPFADIEPEEGETHSKHPLTRQQVSALLDTSEGELQILIALGYFTGLRLGDCCTLKWAEVDMSRGVIERIPNKTRNTVKNKDKAIVKIGIAPYLADLLAGLPRAGAYVLPDMAEKYRGRNQIAIHRAITALFERCGIQTLAPGTGATFHYKGKKKIYHKTRRAVVLYGFHSLRYSYISHNAEAGTPAAVIQRNAGHSNPAMTEHYTRISDEAAVKYAAALALPQPEAAEGEAKDDGDDDKLARLRELAETATAERIEAAIKALEGEP